MVSGYRFQVTLKPSVREKMDILCKEQGLTRSALITLLLNREWKEDGHSDRELESVPDA